MAYYQLKKQMEVQMQINSHEMVFFTFWEEEGSMKKYLMWLAVTGVLKIVDIYQGSSKLSNKLWQFQLIDKKNKSAGRVTIIKAQLIQDWLIIFTFNSIYCSNLSKIMPLLTTKQSLSRQIELTQFIIDRSKINYHKLLNKKIKIIQIDDKVLVKFSGKLKSQIYYYFCSLDLQSSQIQLINKYCNTFKQNYNISLQSLDQDAIIYPIYLKAFSPIEINVINAVKSHKNMHPDHLQYDFLEQKIKIVQFEQTCTIVSIYKLNSDVICILCSSHFQQSGNSFIIVYNIRDKFSINHVNLKDFMITDSFIHGLTLNQEYVYDCIGQYQGNIGIVQVFPFCNYQYECNSFKSSIQIFFDSHQLVLYDQQRKIMTIFKKISKKSLYLHLIQSGFQHLNSLQSSILQLLG